MDEQAYSLLRKAQVRDFPTALAHCYMDAKLDSPRMALLNKHHERLGFGDRARFRAELARCRAAKRGETCAELPPIVVRIDATR